MKKIALFAALLICGTAFFSACSKDDDKKDNTQQQTDDQTDDTETFDITSYYGNYKAVQKGNIAVTTPAGPMSFPVDSMPIAFTISKGETDTQVVKTILGTTSSVIGTVDTNGNVTFVDEKVDIAVILGQLPLAKLVQDGVIPAAMLPMVQGLTGTVTSKTTGKFANGNFSIETNIDDKVQIELTEGAPMDIPVKAKFAATAAKFSN